MNKQFSSNILVVLVSLVGVASTISPASALQAIGIVNSLKPKTKISEIVPLLPPSTTETGAVAKIETTIGEANKLIASDLKETTSTNVGQLAGASTDSLTTASVTDPTQVKLDSLKQYLNQPTEVIQKTGEATVKIKSDEQGIHADAKANLGVEVGKLAKVGICLDSSVSLGSPDDGSIANCPKSVKAQEVPESGTIGGLALLGAYLIYRRKGKVSQSVERQSI